MKWNNRRQRAQFLRKQAKLKEQYIALGMTDEEIQTMYDFDLSEFNCKRREAGHTYRLNDIDLDSVTVELECATTSRYAWIDEIENESVIAAIKSMSRDYIEILTDIVIDGLSQSEIARNRNVKRSAIANKINRIKRIFETFWR